MQQIRIIFLFWTLTGTPRVGRGELRIFYAFIFLIVLRTKRPTHFLRIFYAFSTHLSTHFLRIFLVNSFHWLYPCVAQQEFQPTAHSLCVATLLGRTPSALQCCWGALPLCCNAARAQPPCVATLLGRTPSALQRC